MPNNLQPRVLAVPGFTLGDKLGEGGMGVVYSATDAEFGRPVAIKLVRAERTSDETERRFLDEARITGRLQHPGIPPVHRLGRLPDGRPFLAMKLIAGRTFADLLRDRDHPTDGLARHLQVFEQVCQTVAYAHGQGVIHRDLKPSNVMVGAFSEVQVMDWGLAKELRSPQPMTESTPTPDTLPSGTPGSPATTQGDTGTGMVLGTPAYMPPEQASGEHDRVDARADVFALGAMLCEILTGQPPYGGPYAVVAARQANLAEAHERLDACGADAELVALARRCLAADPAGRPADAGVVAEALAAYRLGFEQRLRQAEQEQAAARVKAAEQAKRRRVQRWLTAAVAVLLVGGGAFTWYADRQANYQVARAETARAALAAAFRQAEGSLRADRPDEVAIALAEARRRLQADAHADPDGGLAARLGNLDGQLAFLLDLERIRDRLWSHTEGKFLNRELAGTEFAAAFQARGLDLGRPREMRERLRGCAIREQVLGALDLWLEADPARDGLLATLGVLDDDGHRGAWRAAVAAGDVAEQARIAPRLDAGAHPPRFIAAYGTKWPRQDGLRLLRLGWSRRPTDLSLALALALLLGKGDWNEQGEAVGFYRVCLGLRPGHTVSLTNLGVLLTARKDLDGAVAAFRQAIAADPTNARAHYNLGKALQSKKDMKGAITAYRDALVLNPKDPLAFNNLGIALRETDDVDGAIEAYRNALALDGRMAAAFNNLGNALAARKHWDAAIEAHNNALALTPRNPGYHYSLGNTLLARDDLDGAIAAYKKALAITPSYENALNGLGMAYTAKHRYDEAIAVFRQAAASNPRNATLQSNLASALLLKGDLVGATAALRKVVGLLPTNAEARHRLGLCLRDRARFSEAVSELRQAHDLGSRQPGWPAPSAERLREAERLLGLDGRLPRVLEGAEEPASTEECAEFARLCLVYRKRPSEALHLYNEALRAQPAALLREWVEDVRLAPVRDPEALAGLPADERRAWQQFWADVRRTLDEPQPKVP